MRCQVTVTTTVDGKKTRVVRLGDLQITPEQVLLTYEEDNALVSVRKQERMVEIVRKGDYSLCIRLEKNKTLDGSLGLGDSEGRIQAKTERIGYSISSNAFSLQLKYTLLMGEPQNMQVKIEAKEV